MKKNAIKKKSRFLKNQKGQGMVEYVLLLVVIIGLVIVFKKPVTEAFEKATGKATGGMEEVIQ